MIWWSRREWGGCRSNNESHSKREVHYSWVATCVSEWSNSSCQAVPIIPYTYNVDLKNCNQSNDKFLRRTRAEPAERSFLGVTKESLLNSRQRVNAVIRKRWVGGFRCPGWAHGLVWWIRPESLEARLGDLGRNQEAGRPGASFIKQSVRDIIKMSVRTKDKKAYAKQWSWFLKPCACTPVGNVLFINHTPPGNVGKWICFKAPPLNHPHNFVTPSRCLRVKWRWAKISFVYWPQQWCH